jgi:hypothetical protein
MTAYNYFERGHKLRKDGALEDAEKAFYVCKHCGAEFSSFKQLVLSPCRKSPRGYHDPL